jgi:uncharacterized protein YraI
VTSFVYPVRTTALTLVRLGPGTGYPVLGVIPPGVFLGVVCKADGTPVDGNPLWYKLAGVPGWIPARYASTLDGVPPFC